MEQTENRFTEDHVKYETTPEDIAKAKNTFEYIINNKKAYITLTACEGDDESIEEVLVLGKGGREHMLALLTEATLDALEKMKTPPAMFMAGLAYLHNLKEKHKKEESLKNN